MRETAPGSRETLVRVVAPHFTAGCVFVDGKCVEAAPILRRWFLGKPEDWCRNWVALKGWKATVVRGKP